MTSFKPESNDEVIVDVDERPLMRSALNIRVRKSTRKPPLGNAKHIYKKIGSLYDTERKGNGANSFLSAEERRKVEEEKYATKVLSEHERSFRSSSAASERARNTSQRLNREISSSMELKQVYDDKIESIDRKKV